MPVAVKCCHDATRALAPHPGRPLRSRHRARTATRCRPDGEERRQAEFDGPKLVEVLELKPGMTVADVGSGFGAMTVVLAH